MSEGHSRNDMFILAQDQRRFWWDPELSSTRDNAGTVESLPSLLPINWSEISQLFDEIKPQQTFLDFIGNLYESQ